MKTLIVSLALAFTGVAAMAADAASAPAGGGGGAACKKDVERLCPGVQPGENRIKTCMKEHRKELSDECKKELQAARKAHKGG